MRAAHSERYKTEAEWLEARRDGVAASEVAAVFGVSPWASPARLWAEKAGLLEPDPPTEAMRLGRRFEPVILELWKERQGRAYSRPRPWTLYRSTLWPWLTATPDGLATGPSGLGVLEAKYVSAWRAEEWEAGPPLHYQLQLQQQMAVLGASWGELAALLGGQRFEIYRVQPHAELREALIDRTADFVKRLRAGGPPILDGSPGARDVLARLYPEEIAGKVVLLPDEALALDAELEQAKKDRSEAEARAERAGTLLRGLLGDAEIGVLPGGQAHYSLRLVTRKGYTVEPSASRRLVRREGAP